MSGLLGVGVRSFVNGLTIGLRLYRRHSSAIDAAFIGVGHPEIVAAIHTLNDNLEIIRNMNPPGPA